MPCKRIHMGLVVFKSLNMLTFSGSCSSAVIRRSMSCRLHFSKLSHNYHDKCAIRLNSCLYHISPNCEMKSHFGDLVHSPQFKLLHCTVGTTQPFTCLQ